jgi:ribosomal protein S18 acetylase RimI-like enzyme
VGSRIQREESPRAERQRGGEPLSEDPDVPTRGLLRDTQLVLERKTMPYTVRPLDASTWDAFAELVERNNGIFGGCWCIGYHPECGQKGISYRAVKEDRVRTGRAHAALVLDEDGAAKGWCQYGSPQELSGIKHKREYEKDAPPRPEWRITCFYVDKRHRGQGIARVALEGALDQIVHAGGGLVEAISEVTTWARPG